MLGGPSKEVYSHPLFAKHDQDKVRLLLRKNLKSRRHAILFSTPLCKDLEPTPLREEKPVAPSSSSSSRAATSSNYKALVSTPKTVSLPNQQNDASFPLVDSSSLHRICDSPILPQWLWESDAFDHFVEGDMFSDSWESLHDMPIHS